MSYNKPSEMQHILLNSNTFFKMSENHWLTTGYYIKLNNVKFSVMLMELLLCKHIRNTPELFIIHDVLGVFNAS